MSVPISESSASTPRPSALLRLPQHQYVAVVFIDLKKQTYSLLDWEGLVSYDDRNATKTIEHALKLASDMGPILVMGGEYNLEGLEVPEKTSLCGAGAPITWLFGEVKFKGYNASDIHFKTDQTWSVSNARLSGCKFRHLRLKECENVRIDGCEIEELEVKDSKGLIMSTNLIGQLDIENTNKSVVFGNRIETLNAIETHPNNIIDLNAVENMKRIRP